MTLKITCVCEGCGEEKPARSDGTLPGDWKEYTITMNNTRGQPICNSADSLKVVAHLCQGCARYMSQQINPHNWPRVSPESAAL